MFFGFKIVVGFHRTGNTYLIIYEFPERFNYFEEKKCKKRGSEINCVTKALTLSVNKTAFWVKPVGL
jgi:hypothetical protein